MRTSSISFEKTRIYRCVVICSLGKTSEWYSWCICRAGRVSALWASLLWASAYVSMNTMNGAHEYRVWCYQMRDREVFCHTWFTHLINFYEKNSLLLFAGYFSPHATYLCLALYTWYRFWSCSSSDIYFSQYFLVVIWICESKFFSYLYSRSSVFTPFSRLFLR